MGFLDLFKKQDSGTSSERELARLQKLVSNKFSQNIDRQDALERLAQMRTPLAADVLLKRFSWTLDPTITDHEEKELAVSGIASVGTPALEPLRRYCARAESLTWPLKALRRIVEGDELVQELLALLDEFDTDYMRNPEPKLQLVQLLGEYPSDDVRIAVEPFLADASEAVRFAAVTTVFAVNDPKSAESLVSALADEESLRVKNRVAQGIAERGWEIPEQLRAKCAQALPDGFSMAGAVIRSFR
jgi:HEAT repeat protein